jgi:hypothetical protein
MAASDQLPRKYQVFISSTFEDLKEERRAVTEVILGMGHIPVGMELFEAGNEDQWSYIQNRIAEVDYYVVIVAERYGSVGREGFSYTEMEYRLAVELGVPVAALLLDGAKRAEWPRNKVDFENLQKVEAFRGLCQQRLVNFWSDAGTLAAKCQLALSGLIRRFPRTGWISADQATPPQLVTEFARLSEENAKLRDEVAQLSRAESASKRVERAAAALTEPLIEDIKKLAAKFGGAHERALANPTIAGVLARSSLFDILTITTVPFFDGEMDSELLSYIRSFLAKECGKSGDDFEILDDLAHVLLLNMRIKGLIESYEVPDPKGSRKQLRLSDLARQAFDAAFTVQLAPADRAAAPAQP